MHEKIIEDKAHNLRTKQYEVESCAKLNAEDSPNGPKVLVVNDEERKRYYIHKALEKFESIRYIDAENGKDAKRICENNNIFMMVMDMSFPWEAGGNEEGISGIRLVKELEKMYESIGKEMPVLIVYSTMMFESAMKTAGEPLSKTFYGQTFYQGGLEELLNDFFNQK